MARILVIGASRGIGLETVKRGLACGHDVRALARSASRIAVRDPKLECVDGDATGEADVAGALDGVDVVIQALGIRVSLQTPFQTITLFSRSTEVLVPLMKKKGPKRLLAVTGIGTGDSTAALSSLERMARDMTLGPVYKDKNIQETLIRNSSLDWTLVRPGFLTWGVRTGRYRAMIDPASWRNGLISRADVADFLVAQVESDVFVRQGPILAY